MRIYPKCTGRDLFQGAVNLRTCRGFLLVFFFIPGSRVTFTVSPILNLISKHYGNCNVVISMKCHFVTTSRFFGVVFLTSGLSRLVMSGAV